MKDVIRTEGAPGAVGPYSQAIRAAGCVWVSGQIPLDPASGTMVAGDIRAQARQSLKNVAAVLEAAGSGMDRVIRATVYLVDMDDFAAVNEEYACWFDEQPPARACVAVSELPKGARVEIDAVALEGDG